MSTSLSERSGEQCLEPTPMTRRQALAVGTVGAIAWHYLAQSWRDDGGAIDLGVPSHGHLTRFVKKIRTPAAAETRIRKQRDRIRHVIRGQIQKAGLALARAPSSGSYAKKTGTIRYVRGKSEVGGQDVDLPFVLTHRSGQFLDLPALLELFHGFVTHSHPRSSVARTKSSIKLKLASFPYTFDLVPMVAHPGAKDMEYLYRADGTKVLTSVSRHVRFVRSRTQASKQCQGIVAFNDMVRLLKWWREIRVNGDDVVSEVPSFLLELLCARAFDEHSVLPTYIETLDAWFRSMADTVQFRREIRFAGSGGVEETRNDGAARWIVRDPANPSNLAVPAHWTDLHIDRLAFWLRSGVEHIEKIREHDRKDNGKSVLMELEKLFGPAIRNLSDAHEA